MPTLDDKLHAMIETFTAELTTLVRRAALETAAVALGGAAAARPVTAGRPVTAVTPVAVTPKRGRPRRAASAAPAAPTPASKRAGTAAPTSKTAASGKPAPAKRPGAKRSPAELARLGDELLDYVKAYPGVRMEALAKALATPAVELRFPVVQLVRAKKVRTEGTKQNMAYFPV
jgi:hypothetical protein